MADKDAALLGWEAVDPRDNSLLSRLMLDSSIRQPLTQGQAIAMGVAYSQLALAGSMDRLSAVLERRYVKEDTE